MRQVLGFLCLLASIGKVSLEADFVDMLQTKEKRHQRVRSEDTAITIKMDDRSQRDLKQEKSQSTQY